MPEFKYQDPFPLGKDTTTYRKLEGSEKYVSVVKFDGQDVLKVDPEALTILANQAFRDVSFLLRPEHNEQVARILRDPEASMNDKGVADRLSAQRRSRRAVRAAALPGHRHRHHRRQKGAAGLDRRPR